MYSVIFHQPICVPIYRINYATTLPIDQHVFQQRTSLRCVHLSLRLSLSLCLRLTLCLSLRVGEEGGSRELRRLHRHHVVPHHSDRHGISRHHHRLSLYHLSRHRQSRTHHHHHLRRNHLRRHHLRRHHLRRHHHRTHHLSRHHRRHHRRRHRLPTSHLPSSLTSSRTPVPTRSTLLVTSLARPHSSSRPPRSSASLHSPLASSDSPAPAPSA